MQDPYSVITFENPYNDITFEKKKVKLVNSEGKIIFEEDITFPDYFDDNSAAIVASRYLCNSAKLKETSLTQMIDRVSNTITEWGIKDGYFEGEEAEQFRYHLKYFQSHQYFAFNSPVN